jgi:hypothetical protein
MLQPVIQLGTAIHGKRFSGGALNRVQKLLHSVDILSIRSIQRKKQGCTLRILANWGAAVRVAAVTARLLRRKPREGLPLLIRAARGTWPAEGAASEADPR